jgi:hypothetical protein
VPQPNGPGRQPLVIAGTPPFRFDGPIGEDPDGELAKELLRKLHDIDNTEIPLEKEITELEKKEAEQWAQKAQQALKNLADKNAKDAKWGKNLLKKLLPSNPESSAGFWKFTRMRVASGAVLLGAAAAAIYGSAHALDTDTMSTEAWQRYLQEERRGARLRRQMKRQDQ